MPTNRIVEALNVLGHVQGSRLAVRIDALLDSLLLQASEEGFGDCVVPAVRPPAHAWLEMVGLAKATPCITSILRFLIRVDQGLSGAPRTNGLRDNFQDQLSMNRRLDGPANDLAREEVHDDGQVEPSLPSPDLGDVRHACLVGPRRRELTLQQITHQCIRLGNRDMTYAVAV